MIRQEYDPLVDPKTDPASAVPMPRIGIFMDKLVFGASPVIAKGEVNGLRRMGINASLLPIKRGAERHSSETERIPTNFLENQSLFL